MSPWEEENNVSRVARSPCLLLRKGMKEVIIKQGVGVFPGSGKKLLILLVPVGTVQRFSHVFKRCFDVTYVSLTY